MRSASIILLATTLLLGGCLSILGGTEWRREPAEIDAAGTLFGSLEAPDRARRGIPFEVTVTTYGSSSCTRPAGAEVHVDGLLAVIRPYDRRPAGDAVCTADLRPFHRNVVLRFDRAGQATIRVVGARGERVERSVTVE